MLEEKFLSFAILVLPATTAIGWSGAALVRRYAANLRLVSVPNYRSSHARPTPHGGGLGIVLGGSVAATWLAWGQSWTWWAMAGLSVVLAMVGLADDIRHLPARVRFTVQLMVVTILLWVTGSTEGADAIPSGPSLIDMAISAMLLLAGLWWINLFNFMDGIDGIAASQAVFMLLSATALGASFHPDVMETITWLWMLGVAAAALGFLMLNWPPAKVFMGDVGSTYLAFMIFAFALISVRQGWLSYEAWIILGATFVTDATVTLTRRMLDGERWFEAHRSHAYQRLARRFAAHQPVTLIAIAINMLWLVPLAWLSLAKPVWAQLVVVVAYLPLTIAVLKLGAGKKDNV